MICGVLILGLGNGRGSAVGQGLMRMGFMGQWVLLLLGIFQAGDPGLLDGRTERGGCGSLEVEDAELRVRQLAR